MEGIRQAIEHGAAAGKLRAYVRENGGDLAGFIRLADRHGAAVSAALDQANRARQPRQGAGARP